MLVEKPLKHMTVSDLLFMKTCAMQKRRKLDEKIKKLSMVVGKRRYENHYIENQAKLIET